MSRLYRQRITNAQVLVLVAAGLFALGVALASTPAGQTLYSLLGARFDDVTSWMRSWLVEDSAAIIGG